MKDTVVEELERLEPQEEVIELAPGETSLSFMQKIYRSVRQPMQRRMRAAEYAMQFEHPKLGAVATTALNGKDFATLLERAIQRSGMTPEQIREARELRLIEGGKEQIETQAVD
jgi:hypothetical protein